MISNSNILIVVTFAIKEEEQREDGLLHILPNFLLICDEWGVSSGISEEIMKMNHDNMKVRIKAR